MAGTRFFFDDTEIRKIHFFLKDYYPRTTGYEVCRTGLITLEKLINCEFEDEISEKDKNEIKKNIEEADVYLNSLEHIISRLITCIPANKLINPRDTNLYSGDKLEARKKVRSGLASYYCQLPMRDNESIMDAIDNCFDTIKTQLSEDTLKELKNPKWQEYEAQQKERGKSGEDAEAPKAEYFFEIMGIDEKFDTLIKFLRKYEDDWSPEVRCYAYAWACRNEDIHKGIDAEIMRKCYFVVLIDCCNRFKQEIEQKYRASIIKKVKIEAFKTEVLCKNQKLAAFMEDKFTELKWNDGKNIVWNNTFPSIMLIGEAGAGKSTEMEKLYWDELNKLTSSYIPIWLPLCEYTTVEVGENEDRLVAWIKKELGRERAEWYEEIMKAGLIKLFLDGLNEIVISDREKTKEQLVKSIKAIRKNYPDVKICMTDRVNELTIECVSVAYACKSMDEDDCLKYCTRYYDEAFAEEVVDFVEENDWFLESEEPTTPEKVNGLAEMMKNGKRPDSEDEYYAYYIEHILEREKNKEGTPKRIKRLKRVLHQLAVGMSGANAFWYAHHIMDFLEDKEACNLDPEYADELFELACKIPLLVEKNGKYGFVNEAYYNYFVREDIKL